MMRKETPKFMVHCPTRLLSLNSFTMIISPPPLLMVTMCKLGPTGRIEYAEFSLDTNKLNKDDNIHKKRSFKKCFYISAFCSRTDRPTNKIFIEYMLIYERKVCTKNGALS